MGDALSSLLRDIRPSGALFDQTVVSAPWSLRFAEAAPLTLLTMLSGEAWAVPEHGDAVPLRTGDVVLVNGPDPFTVADAPTTAPMAVLGASGSCTASDGDPLDGELPMCRPTGHPAGSTVLLKVAYRVHGRLGGRVLDSLPRLARIPALPGRCPTLDMISAEIGEDAPGRDVILDRLLDLLLVSSLREWFKLPTTDAPAWYRAHGDPVVGRALRAIHEAPARPWTVARLAARAGVSRAAFAERFTRLVDRPPMAYLAEWRVSRAADLLATTDATVAAVARQVGYSSSYALSVAFKRTLGVRPTEYRDGARGDRAA
ncbi:MULTISPECIES: AraC family transcriptional regulator [unclassified Streptomyces]|uniref:AraC family transcriptional regulator n=1 Tax=unclassified Streptomyces TaxID=2593676 RepID=UPI00344AC97F